MPSNNWDRVNELFHAALERDATERSTFLKDACGSDEPLRQEVESLLQASQDAGDFIQAPIVKDAMGYLTHSEELLVGGDRIGSYKVVREIGRGGMGAVYLAERADEQFHKLVAVKLIKRGMDSEFVLRHFHTERQILANFDHPNIARLLDAGSTENGLPYLVMEYVEGQPMDTYCDAQGLTISQRLSLFQKVCAAVSYAHQNLVVHRDIKPSNILVTAEGVPKLLDFGIAKLLQGDGAGDTGLTVTGMRMMTPEYASPEQAQGSPVTTLSDLYSLGVLLYILLTGQFPYRMRGHTPLDIARTITETMPQLPSQIVRDEVEESSEGSITPESISKAREGSPDRLRRRLRGDLDNIVLMALRKEPQRRYQSVDQFSEDIRRHLDGLPVIARKDTFVYRAGKFAQRNKVAVATFAFAAFAIAIFAVIAGVIQWRANQQAKFLQEFGQEAARLEGIMRFAYMLPLHNASYERGIVRSRVRALGVRMNHLGGNAQGPGQYAMGRGFMALQDYSEAQKHFELSLQKYRYQTPEVSYSYGFTLAMIYQNELESAGRIASDELRKKRLGEIEKEFKEPALRFIRQGKDSIEYSEYAEAIVQFLDGNYQDAIRKSERAMQQIPWLYESKRLEGESYRNLGRISLDQGKHSDALNSFTNAEKAFEDSIQKGASDPLGYEGVCSLYPDIVWLYFLTGGKADTPYLRGKESCEKAIQADPGSAETYMHISRLDAQYNRYLENSGNRGNQELLEQSVQAAQKAVKLLPDDARTYVALGNAYHSLAGYLYLSLTDPTKVVTAGDQSFERGIRINPNDAGAYYSRGQLLWIYAQYLTDTGSDPRQVLDRAVHYMQTSMRLNAGDYRPYHMMGNLLFAKGDYESGVGLDPSKSLNASQQILRKALGINTGLLPGYYSLAFADKIQATYLTTVGRDPGDVIKDEKAAYDQVLKLSPNAPYALQGLAEAALQKAQYCVATKTDPTAHLNESTTDAEACLVADPKSPECNFVLGSVQLLNARWKALNGESPEIPFQRSLRLFNLAIEFSENQNYLEAVASKANLYRWWAEWKIGSKRKADHEVRAGLDTVSKALSINSRFSEMFALRGVLFLLQAHAASNPSQRNEYAHKAEDSLQEALKGNANLSHAFQPYLQEAQTFIRN